MISAHSQAEYPKLLLIIHEPRCSFRELKVYQVRARSLDPELVFAIQLQTPTAWDPGPRLLKRRSYRDYIWSLLRILYCILYSIALYYYTVPYYTILHYTRPYPRRFDHGSFGHRSRPRHPKPPKRSFDSQAAPACSKARSVALRVKTNQG